jgi:excisionase family DNA binding protein
MCGAVVRESVQVAGRGERAWVVRAFVGAVLGPGHPCGDDAVLLVSELFSNSVRHSHSGHRELDQTAGDERASVRHRAARRAAPVGGSNRLLSVEELAAYLGVPKKTVYGCWRQWGLRGYRVGRYLRFRERHVEEWLQSREV